jgi:HD-GYP domain-containing protein (c-di-GMP phosphodiesterase class II)
MTDQLTPAAQPQAAPHAGIATPSEREVMRRGRDFLFAFATCLRSLQLYPMENQTVGKALGDLEALVADLLALEEEVSVRYVGNFFFVNDVRLRVDLASYATFGTVGRALARHGIGHFDFFRGIQRVEWTAFLSILLTEPSDEDAFDVFSERLTRSAVLHIAVGPLLEETGGDDDEARRMAKRTYAQSVAVAREVMGGLRMGRGVSLRPVKRAVQSIVDQVLSNETSIVGLTTLRDYDEYTFTHCVNVCIFSVALGKKLGFDKHQLYELGLGALMHDVGKVKMPHEVVNKNGPLTAEEARRMQEHPTEGVLVMFGMRGLAEVPLRAMLQAYEHHMKTDQTGYPRSVRPRNPTLFSRIVAVADGFDAATSKRSYQAQPWPPDQVLREMRDNPARGFDPLVVKAFISMTGIYPVGSVVILDTFELGIVCAPNPRADLLHQPVVKVIYDSMGVPVEPARTIDLSEVDPDTGRPRRTIIKTTDPDRYGINVGEYFV